MFLLLRRDLVHECWSKIGIPSVSRPLSRLRLSISWLIKLVVVSALRVRRRQWSANSLWVSSRRAADSSQFSSVAWHRLAMSSVFHSNMHIDSRDMKTPYSWWLAAVQPLAKRRIRCQMSRRTCMSCHPRKIRPAAGPQQSRST